jgi:DNA-binding NarL/FixJ family response regulator
MTTKVLVADDHEIVRTGVASLLENSDVKVVAQAANGTEAINLAAKHKPDVVLMDIRMEPTDGLTALEKIRKQSPDTQVIMLSTYDNPTYMARALALGASDYVLKGTSREQLLATIKAVASGDRPAQSDKLRRVASAMDESAPTVEDDVALTKRETQVLRHVALGLSNKEIGKSLEISVETVKEHVQNILRKIRATDRTQAAVWAVRKGMV